VVRRSKKTGDGWRSSWRSGRGRGMLDMCVESCPWTTRQRVVGLSPPRWRHGEAPNACRFLTRSAIAAVRDARGRDWSQPLNSVS
jgi:hypothetical protein